MDSHDECGDKDFKDVFPVSVFRLSWYHFLGLKSETIEFKSGFMCDERGPNPWCVIFDGTAFSHKKKYAFFVYLDLFQ